MQIPIVGGAYRLPRQVPMSAQQCVNLMPQRPEQPAKTDAMLVPTPGLRRLGTLPTAPVRQLLVTRGLLYVVAGNRLYRVRLSPSFDATDLGTLTSTTGPVQMASNGQQVLIVDGIRGYLYDLAAQAFAPIADPDFPAGVTSCAFVSGYFVVCGNGTGQAYWSDLYAGASWQGLSFSTAEGQPDNVIGCMAEHGLLWLLGETTTEVFTRTEVDFARVGNAFIEHGCAAAGSVAKVGDSIYWLQADDRGEGAIYRTQGFVPVPVSTDAITQAIAGFGSISDAVAYSYSDGARAFYCLNFPSGRTTFVYDAKEGEWHERQWRDPATGVLSRHRGQVQAFYDRTQVLGDYESGALYALDPAIATDDGNTIVRVRSSQAASERQNLATTLWGRFELDAMTGVGTDTGQGADPVIMLEWSDDGGVQFTNPRPRSLGRTGSRWTRAKWERCHPTGLRNRRNRVWRFSWTDPVITAVMGAAAFAQPGAE